MDAKTPSKGDQLHARKSTHFLSSAMFLNDLDAKDAARIVSAAADLALIIEDGVIRDVAISENDLIDEGYGETWRGKRWIDTVTPDSRTKIEELLAHASQPIVWRQVNHPSSSALDVPVKYTAVRIGGDNRLIALGRDLRAVAMLQQRLVEAHQGLERDYARLREIDARYRTLFESISEPVLVVDAVSLRVEAANPAAGDTLEAPADRLVGKRLTELVAAHHVREAETLALETSRSGAAHTQRIELRPGKEAALHASAFREDRATRLIVRLEVDTPETRKADERRSLLSVLEQLPDGLILVDADWRLLAANMAFRDLAKATAAADPLGESLSDYLGRSSTDLNVFFSTLKKYGVIRNFATVMRDRFGAEEPVEVSAVAAPTGDDEVYALSIRSVARRLPSAPGLAEQLPSSTSQLTDLVGRVPLKDIVRESTVLIEKLCIEAALEITDNNRASAAEMLGLSRQGLYSKIKRSGLGAGG